MKEVNNIITTLNLSDQDAKDLHLQFINLYKKAISDALNDDMTFAGLNMNDFFERVTARLESNEIDPFLLDEAYKKTIHDFVDYLKNNLSSEDYLKVELLFRNE